MLPIKIAIIKRIKILRLGLEKFVSQLEVIVLNGLLYVVVIFHKNIIFFEKSFVYKPNAVVIR